MGKVKAIDLMELKKVLNKRKLEEQFLSLLDPDTRHQFINAVATTWLPLDSYTKIVCAAAPLVFPGESNALHELGRKLTPQTLNFVYKAFIRIPKVAFLAKRSAFIWRTYYQKGEAETIDATENSITLVINNFPEIPQALRINIAGSIRGIIELTDAVNVKVQLDERNPNAWKFLISWE